MQKVEIIGLTITDFQKMLDDTIERAAQKLKVEQKLPSDWEELTLDQAAAELNCCKATIRRKMKQLNIACLKIGKEILIKRIDLKKIKKASIDP